MKSSIVHNSNLGNAELYDELQPSVEAHRELPLFSEMERRLLSKRNKSRVERMLKIQSLQSGTSPIKAAPYRLQTSTDLGMVQPLFFPNSASSGPFFEQAIPAYLQDFRHLPTASTAQSRCRVQEFQIPPAPSGQSKSPLKIKKESIFFAKRASGHATATGALRSGNPLQTLTPSLGKQARPVKHSNPPNLTVSIKHYLQLKEINLSESPMVDTVDGETTVKSSTLAPSPKRPPPLESRPKSQEFYRSAKRKSHFRNMEAKFPSARGVPIVAQESSIESATTGSNIKFKIRTTPTVLKEEHNPPRFKLQLSKLNLPQEQQGLDLRGEQPRSNPPVPQQPANVPAAPPLFRVERQLQRPQIVQEDLHKVNKVPEVKGLTEVNSPAVPLQPLRTPATKRSPTMPRVSTQSPAMSKRLNQRTPLPLSQKLEENTTLAPLWSPDKSWISSFDPWQAAKLEQHKQTERDRFIVLKRQEAKIQRILEKNKKLRLLGGFQQHLRVCVNSKAALCLPADRLEKVLITKAQNMKMQEAAMRIQRWFRNRKSVGYQARKLKSIVKRLVIIKRFVRKLIQRVRLSKRIDYKRQAATVLVQRCLRGYLDRQACLLPLSNLRADALHEHYWRIETIMKSHLQRMVRRAWLKHKEWKKEQERKKKQKEDQERLRKYQFTRRQTVYNGPAFPNMKTSSNNLKVPKKKLSEKNVVGSPARATSPARFHEKIVEEEEASQKGEDLRSPQTTALPNQGSAFGNSGGFGSFKFGSPNPDSAFGGGGGFGNYQFKCINENAE